MLLTIFLKRDQTLAEIDRQLERTGFWRKFQTLRLPPEKLREVNLAIEQNAWAAYRTGFYATYDFRPFREMDQ